MREEPSKDQPRKKHQGLPHYDLDLLGAKKREKNVKFTLAFETDFTSEDCQVEGLILLVDRYQIKLRVGTEKVVWIAKQGIVATEILP